MVGGSNHNNPTGRGGGGGGVVVFVRDMCEPRQVCSVSQQVSGRNLPLVQVFAAPARDFTLYPSLALRKFLSLFFHKPFRVLRSLSLHYACEVFRR